MGNKFCKTRKQHERTQTFFTRRGRRQRASTKPTSTTIHCDVHHLHEENINVASSSQTREEENVTINVISHQDVHLEQETVTIGDNTTGYGQFRLALESLLTRSQAETLATWFGYPPAKTDNTSKSDSPSRIFVQFMNERGEISPTDISTLINALESPTVGLAGVAVQVKEAFRKHLPVADLSSLKNEKMLQFVAELKRKYKNLCGGIHPVPFLRDEYDIDQLFVEGKIEFLDERQGESKEQEKWTMLKGYKMVFTDPQIKSKRRIIEGEPGYGKSTLALQITQDWCQERSPMNDVEILILLRLRQYKKVPTVFSAIKKFLLPKDSKLTEYDIKNILDNSSTVIVLDSYDEYPEKEKPGSDIEDIIRGDMFQNHEVVLTTRTSCLPPKYSRETKRIRLTGFDDAARDTYIRKIVVGGSSEDADKINQFIKTNPVPADLRNIPLFFSMIAYMVHKNERFCNLNTVTEFFHHIIKCFHSHDEIKEGEMSRGKDLDHMKLDEIALKGLSGDAQKISWRMNELKAEIGQDLYEVYVRIGIILEEECYDYDAMDYITEVRFYHKLFAEWFAAHHLAKTASQFSSKFAKLKEHNIRHQATNRCDLFERLNPYDLHYMYRFACGLNPEAGLIIIKHLGDNIYYNVYTLLCITEWGGNPEEILEVVTLFFANSVVIRHGNSLLFKKTIVELIIFADNKMIPIDCLRLNNCLDIGSNGNLHVKRSSLCLPVMNTTVVKLWIEEYGREITEEETDIILQYSAKCLGLRILQFDLCLFPRYIKVTESMSVLRKRHVRVVWSPTPSEYRLYLLNLESGQWMDELGCETMTDEEYQEAEEEIPPPLKEKDDYGDFSNFDVAAFMKLNLSSLFPDV